VIGLLIAVLLAQQPVPSTLVPPAVEERVVFSHAGFTYFVGKSSGSVIAIEQGGVRPVPPPVPDEDETKPEPVSGIKWFSVVVDESKPEQQAWRTDPEIRKLLESRGIQYRSYIAGEVDIDRLGFQTTVGQIGLPTVILQDQAGKIVKSTSPQTKADIIKLVEVIK
jgi:hypothetical protein